MSQPATMASGSFHPHSRHRLAITDVARLQDSIWVQYLVTPVPAELAESRVLHESEDAWAVDERHHCYRCTTACRRARHGDRVVGALRIAGVAGVDHGLIRVLFSPLVLAPALAGALCQLDLSMGRGTVQAVAVHSSRSHDRASVRDRSGNP